MAFDPTEDAVEDDEPVAKDFLGAEAKLEITPEAGDPMTITGRVGRCRVRLTARGSELQVTLVPVAAFALQALASVVVLEHHVGDVIKAVLARHGITEPVLRLETHPKRPHWVQHRESDWSYLERIAAYDDADVARLLADAGIVRNRAKVLATITNARPFAPSTSRSRASMTRRCSSSWSATLPSRAST